MPAEARELLSSLTSKPHETADDGTYTLTRSGRVVRSLSASELQWAVHLVRCFWLVSCSSDAMHKHLTIALICLRIKKQCSMHLQTFETITVDNYLKKRCVGSYKM